MIKEEMQVQVHLPGILTVLGQNLYSNPYVALREILQNAHDACNRRVIEDSNFEAVSKIFIETNYYNKTITISDNGSGLTKNEISTFLATIGKGYTGELKQSLEKSDKEKALSLIGQFGLGLLSGFLIANKIEIKTKSFSSNQGLMYSSDGSGKYTVESFNKKDVGSECTLSIKDEYEFLLEDDNLISIIQNYACFLPIAIFVNNSHQPINNLEAPWINKDAGNKSYENFIKGFYNINPLAVIPLNENIKVDGENILVKGVLFIPENSLVSTNEYGDLMVYIRNMFICSNEQQLLPSWAKFVSGIVECPNLNPTASRESVRKDDVFEIVQHILETKILSYFKDIKNKDKVRTIVENHNMLIKIWSIHHESFFYEIKDLVLFSTDKGLMNLPDYLKENNNKIYYFNNDSSKEQAKMFFSSLGGIVIDARNFTDEIFIKNYLDVHEDTITLESCDDLIKALLRKSSNIENNINLEFIRNFFSHKDVKVKFIKLPFPELPIYYPNLKEFQLNLDLEEKVKSDNNMPKAVKNVIKSKINTDKNSFNSYIYININNSLINKIIELSEKDKRINLLELIYSFSLLLSGKASNEKNYGNKLKTFSKTLENLLA